MFKTEFNVWSKQKQTWNVFKGILILKQTDFRNGFIVSESFYVL